MRKQPYFDKQYLKRVSVYVLVSIVSVSAILYLSYHLSNNFKDRIETVFARQTTLSSSITCEGYIMRDETPLYAEGISSGSLSATLEDGQKVRAFSKVADIYEISAPDTESKLSSIEKQIALLENCKSMSMTVGDTSSIDDTIFSTVVEMRKAAEGGNFSKELSLKTDLFVNMKKRDVLTGAIVDFDEQIKLLEAEKEKLKASLGACLETIYSPSSGYYYSECDGYEEIFSSKDIDSLTLSDFADKVKKDSSAVQSGKFSAGKLVNSHKWYFACPMSLTEAAKIKENEADNKGTSYEVTLQNNSEEPLNMTVYKILSNASDALILFECSAVKAGYDFTRFQSAKVVIGEMTGYKIPISALRLVDGVEGVYILDQVTVEFRKVSVIDEAGGYYLCTTNPAEDGSDAGEWLLQNDVILVGGTGLQSGMTYSPAKR